MQFPARLPRPVLDFILKVKMSKMKGGEKRRKEMNIINDETNPSKARFTAGTTRNIDQDQIDFLT